MTKKQLILAMFGLLVLSGIELAPLSPAFAEEETKKEEGGGKKGKDTDITGGRFAGDPIYVHLAPIILPAITDSGVEQLITIVFDVQVKDFDAADKMHSNMPKIRDSLMRNLYGGLGGGALRNGKLVNIVRLKTKAMAAISEVIGDENVEDVLVQNVSQRML